MELDFRCPNSTNSSRMLSGPMWPVPALWVGAKSTGILHKVLSAAQVCAAQVLGFRVRWGKTREDPRFRLAGCGG